MQVYPVTNGPISDSKVSSHLFPFDVPSINAEHNFRFISNFLKQTHFHIGIEAILDICLIFDKLLFTSTRAKEVIDGRLTECKPSQRGHQLLWMKRPS